MSQGLVIYKIKPRNGKLGIPRKLIREHVIRLQENEDLVAVAKKTLNSLKRRVRADGRDRQIDIVRITPKRIGHDISERVWRRIYRSSSDGMVYVYEGESQRTARKGQPSGSVEANLVSVS